jgi:hypothetical protein
MPSWNRLTHAAGILDNLIDRSESSTEPCATRDLDARQRISENATGTRGRLLMAAAAPYRSGPSRDWIKVKNPASPAMVRHLEERW